MKAHCTSTTVPAAKERTEGVMKKKAKKPKMSWNSLFSNSAPLGACVIGRSHFSFHIFGAIAVQNRIFRNLIHSMICSSRINFKKFYFALHSRLKCEMWKVPVRLHRPLGVLSERVTENTCIVWNCFVDVPVLIENSMFLCSDGKGTQHLFWMHASSVVNSSGKGTHFYKSPYGLSKN